MKHIKKVSIQKAQGCDINNATSIVNGLQGPDPLGCVGMLLQQALQGDKTKNGEQPS